MFLIPVFMCLENTRSLLQLYYKGIISLEWRIIAVDPLLQILAHHSLLSFSVWKATLSCEIWRFRKDENDCWFFCPVCIHYVNMNQSFFLLFYYLCHGTACLEDFYFVLDGHMKRPCFISKRWLTVYSNENRN